MRENTRREREAAEITLKPVLCIHGEVLGDRAIDRLQQQNNSYSYSYSGTYVQQARQSRVCNLQRLTENNSTRTA